MNFHSILTDLFGASLMSTNPHQEIVDRHDVRRHGGGMGVVAGHLDVVLHWIPGLGFMVGARRHQLSQPVMGLLYQYHHDRCRSSPQRGVSRGPAISLQKIRGGGEIWRLTYRAGSRAGR